MGWRDSTFTEKLKCRVLVVGAGGIGCELLKNLVLTGFSSIDIIDLDTIDVSNLNRQFLFRREHVGQSKAKTAAEAVRALAPSANIVYHHDSVFNEEYNVDFFQQFTLVLGALDNRAARSHVNRLCLAAKVPLIDSGSSGYRGQVSIILRDRTECYECVAKPVQKTYPGCTIRNTPSEPVHCVVWAKHLFNQLFGEVDVDDDVSPDTTDEEIANGNSKGKLENGTAEAMNDSPMSSSNGDKENDAVKICVREWASANNFNAEVLFRKFFHDDINYLLSMANLWKERRKPVPLDWNDLPNQNPGSSRREPNSSLWTVLECKEYFEKTLEVLKERARDGKILVWDKDDDASMQFVAACANIRAHIFNIPMKTLFDIKSIAGNIIPAIATTNAMVAGMLVVEALKLVFGRESALRNIFVQPMPSGKFCKKLLADEMPVKPNPQCYVCSERREISVKINTAVTSVRSLETKFLKGMINMAAPDAIIAGTPNYIISSEEGFTEGIAEKMLDKVGVLNGTLLECDDFLQQFEVRVRIVHDEELKVDEFTIVTDSKKLEENGAGKEKLLVRKRASDLEEPVSPKRARITVEE